MAARGSRAQSAGPAARVDHAAVTELQGRFDGQIIEPGDADYDTARLVWNSMVDRRPALILRPAGTVDVAAAVRFARKTGLEIAVKGGGHGPAGHATVDDGLMIDLGAMRGVRVDPQRRLVWAQGGARLVDLDREASVHGLAVPAGVNWDTGLAGLLLGGGYGWLARLYGLSSDNLVSAEVVTAEGEVVLTDVDHDPELLWGLRGGGGNFGIVTWFELRAYPVPPRVQALDLVFDPTAAPELAPTFFDLAAAWPRSLTGYFSISGAPDSEGIPDAARGGPSVLAGFVAIDENADVTAIARPLTELAEPWTTTPWSGSFRELQHLSSEAPGARRRRYWKGHYVSEVSAAFVREFATIGPERPFYADVEVFQLGGAVADLPADATAYGNRDAAFDILAVGYWDDPAEDDARLAALRATAARFEPFSSGVYLNNLVDDAATRVREAFREERFDQLRALKTRMDPENVFHRNANIPPLQVDTA
jgi:FAD/FMN-containing dehydrogenase